MIHDDLEDNDLPVFERIPRHGIKRFEWQFQCSGKMRYAEKSIARAKVRGATNRGVRLCAYICPWCHYFHVGNPG